MTVHPFLPGARGSPVHAALVDIYEFDRELHNVGRNPVQYVLCMRRVIMRAEGVEKIAN
jgi:hypothetical protein